MSDSLALLALSPREAEKELVKELIKPGVDINSLTVGQYLVKVDGDVILPVYSSDEAYTDPEWYFRGGADLTYKRLDLRESFGHLGLSFRVGERYTTDELLTQLGSILQIHFAPGEFFRDTMTLTQHWDRYRLRAAPDSPRWKGEVSILVYR